MTGTHVNWHYNSSAGHRGTDVFLGSDTFTCGQIIIHIVHCTQEDTGIHLPFGIHKSRQRDSYHLVAHVSYFHTDKLIAVVIHLC